MRAASPRLVGAAVSLQLLAAAAVVATWQVPVPVPVAVVEAAPPLPLLTGPVRLSSPLWDGPVEARPLPLDGRGALTVPGTADGLGWWADGPLPGDPGAAVVVGHVDLAGRDGVFARLASAKPGDVVVVLRGDVPLRFRVTRVDRYAKAAFPTDVVYRPASGTELRLVTCGGRFDRRTGHYEDNVVVQTVLV